MNEVATITEMPFEQMLRLADAIAKSGMFGIKTPDQALVLMSIAQAEGRHPALAARDYHIIQNTPAKKAEAMLRDFLSSGGHVEWHALTDDVVDATFSHPSGGSARINWDKARVQRAGLSSNSMHSKYPRQMLRSRVVSEGVRTVWPMATSGMYVPEEVNEFDRREPLNVTPPQVRPLNIDPGTGEVIERDIPMEIHPTWKAGQQAAEAGTDALRQWWMALSSQDRGMLGARGRSSGPHMEKWKEIAAKFDRKDWEHDEAAPPAAQSPEAGASVVPADPPPGETSEDGFGLKVDTQDVYVSNVMEAVVKCDTLDGVQAIKDARYPYARQNLDKRRWDDLETRIGEHETLLYRAGKAQANG